MRRKNSRGVFECQDPFVPRCVKSISPTRHFSFQVSRGSLVRWNASRCQRCIELLWKIRSYKWWLWAFHCIGRKAMGEQMDVPFCVVDVCSIFTTNGRGDREIAWNPCWWNIMLLNPLPPKKRQSPPGLLHVSHNCHPNIPRWFQTFFIFTLTWGNDQIWRAYFSDGWFNHQLDTPFCYVFPSWKVSPLNISAGSACLTLLALMLWLLHYSGYYSCVRVLQWTEWGFFGRDGHGKLRMMKLSSSISEISYPIQSSTF